MDPEDLKNTLGNKSNFSIECLLGSNRNAEESVIDEDIPFEEHEQREAPTLIRPQPLIPTRHQRSSCSEATASGEETSDEDSAIAAAIQSSLFYSQHPTNFLYSQWLATRNTSALFGLQGTQHFSSKAKGFMLFMAALTSEKCQLSDLPILRCYKKKVFLNERGDLEVFAYFIITFDILAPKPVGRRARKPGVDRKPRQAYSAKQLDRLESEFKVCSINLHSLIRLFFYIKLV